MWVRATNHLFLETDTSRLYVRLNGRIYGPIVSGEELKGLIGKPGPKGDPGPAGSALGAWPVGSVYLAVGAANPNLDIGGTWADHGTSNSIIPGTQVRRWRRTA